MPRGAKEEDGFVYLSDPFIRRLMGPTVKLTERRRVLCYNHLRMIGHAALLYRTEHGRAPQSLEELEQSLTVLEEKLFAIILTTAPEAELLTLRQQAAAELAPYRSRMPTMQIRQVERQFLHKRLLEKFNLPRLSLFYMSQG